MPITSMSLEESIDCSRKNNIPCSGQFGFLYEMIMTVQQKVLNNDPFFTPFVQEIEDWDSFYNHYMTPYRDLLDLQVCFLRSYGRVRLVVLSLRRLKIHIHLVL